MAADEGLSANAYSELVTESSRVFKWHMLSEDRWQMLRDVRLNALKESPKSFLSKYERESTYEENQWREEFSRGEWFVVGNDGPPQGMIGVTRSSDISPADRYLEYLWIAPKSRNYGLATSLVRAVVERLAAAGISAVWLWILDGNESARKLYEKCGFTSTGERQPPQADPTLCEERMKLIIT